MSLEKYAYLFIHIITKFKMKAMNLRKNKKGHMGGLEERKVKREIMLFRLLFKK